MEDVENKNTETETKSKPARKKSARRFTYNNKWIVMNIPFYLFVAALLIIYIANGHYADRTIRKINATAKHLKEMEYEFKTIKRDVIFRSKESELAKAVEPLGLKPLPAPPVQLIDTLDNN
ncbi:MAG: FtsL-like putative cell division protein [Bacteroidota bacterium]|nr:FtsL-like putative cell division protein [Bacteroidota bacterium]